MTFRERSLEWNQCLVVGLAEAEPLVADMVPLIFFLPVFQSNMIWLLSSLFV